MQEVYVSTNFDVDREKDFDRITLFLTTRNRTKDTLMSVNHYSQMLCQLSYGEAGEASYASESQVAFSDSYTRLALLTHRCAPRGQAEPRALPRLARTMPTTGDAA